MVKMERPGKWQSSAYVPYRKLTEGRISTASCIAVDHSWTMPAYQDGSIATLPIPVQRNVRHTPHGRACSELWYFEEEAESAYFL